MDKRLHIVHLKKSSTFKLVVELTEVKHDVMNSIYFSSIKVKAAIEHY